MEVRVAPPQEYQPKVQAEIKLLDTKRETAEYKMLESLEKKYNEELVGAGKKFKVHRFYKKNGFCFSGFFLEYFNKINIRESLIMP